MQTESTEPVPLPKPVEQEAANLTPGQDVQVRGKNQKGGGTETVDPAGSPSKPGEKEATNLTPTQD